MYLIEPIRNGKYLTDGALVLAMQVYVLENIQLDEPILFPYYCDPKVEIGRFQNAEVEINKDYLEANHIQLVRRDTGGGAVYVDRGAVNICFVIPAENSNIYGNFKEFYTPAIQALHRLGATNVEQKGRNDLVIEGKKVSGAAMTMVDNRIYGGYSLLLDVDYDAMVNVLNPNRKKIDSKGIKSVRSRVTSIRPHLAQKYQHVTTHEFKDLIVAQLLGIDNIQAAKRYELTDADWQAIETLTQQKYKDWEWTYGNSPRYAYNRDGRLSVGTIDISLSVEKGRIAACRIYGDFFAKGNIEEVESALIGTRVIREDLLEVLSQLELTHYFGNVEPKELVDLILS